MRPYVYRGHETIATEDQRATEQEWVRYEALNALACAVYDSSNATLDARHDPEGGGRHWETTRTCRRKK